MTMPAGRFYIGDLCYVMSDEEWDQVCKLIIKDNKCIDGEFNLPDGRRFAIYSTAWGDGLYKDQFGRDYCVDSGSIGCILIDDIKSERYTEYENLERLGSISEFAIDFTTSGGRGREGWDGVICIGGVKIHTDDDEF